MFGRLNPTKPPAHFRATLERAGAACRKARPLLQSNDRSPAERDAAIVDAFVTHGLFGIGVSSEYGGAGSEALLMAMALERIGREGFDLVHRFLNDHAIAASVISLWGTEEHKNTTLRRMPTGQCVSLLHRWPHLTDTPAAFTYDAVSNGFIIEGRLEPAVVPHRASAMIVVAHDNAKAVATCFIVNESSFTRHPVVQEAGRAAPEGAAFELKRCELTEPNVLGTIGGASEVMRSARMLRRLGLAAGAVGAMGDHLERFLELHAAPGK